MTTPAQGTTPLPLAPQPVPEAASPPKRRRAGADALLVILVLVLAFLASSFPARNSDVWFHLATGQLLAQRQFTFGVDPFSYTTEGIYWVCHSWLFDLALFGMYKLTGGVGVIVCKALLVAVLAGLMQSMRRPAGAAWLPLVCTSLAILAMSPRLLVQPACVSYLLLGVTFWLLWKSHANSEVFGDSRARLRLAAKLLFLFVLWANVDEWFWLGPLLVALFWLGERLGGQRRTPGWLVPAGLAVCLLNPHTYHVFALPAELSPVSWNSGLRHDARFQGQFASSLQIEYLQTAAHLNASSIAYLALTLLGLASFLLYRPALLGWRSAVWLPFALLAAWQTWAIPFFAVVAGPILALNGQDYLADQKANDTERPTLTNLFAAAGKLLLALSLLALGSLAWLGGLAGQDREERHVAWEIQAEPSLRRAAEMLADWRQRGLLPAEERTFAVAPQSAHYAAFFAPSDRQFLDHRYPLYPNTARDYETVCRALMPDLAKNQLPLQAAANETNEAEGDWRNVLKKNNIGIIIFYDRSPARLYALLAKLGKEPKEWTLLGVAGQAVIVGWNRAGSHRHLVFDAEQLAFGQPTPQAPSVPEQGPDPLPQRRDWTARLTRPPRQPSWESAAATVFLHYFHDSANEQIERRYRSLLHTYAAGLTALPAQSSALPSAVYQLASARDLFFPREAERLFPSPQQLGPFFVPMLERAPALPLLAVRAARQAVAFDPEDANAWLRLGQAYLLLRNLTREHSKDGLLPPLAQLRHVQIATALEQALRLNPELEAAHQELAALYGERRHLDRALEHRREEIHLSRQAGPRAGESVEKFALRMARLEQETAHLVEDVETSQKQYSSASRSLQGDRKKQAELALNLGLARQALDDILLLTPADVLGPAGIKLELNLLLTMGRAAEVRNILNDRGLRASKHGLGDYDLSPPQNPFGGPLYAAPYRWPAYEWLHALAAAALGDYAQAHDDLHALRGGLRAREERRRLEQRDIVRGAPILVPGLFLGPTPFLPAQAALDLGRLMQSKARYAAEERSLQGQQADLAILDGLLALEQGQTNAARASLAEGEKTAAAVPFAGRSIAASYLSLLKTYQRTDKSEPRP